MNRMHAKFRMMVGALMIAAPLALAAQDTSHVADSAAAAATARQLLQQNAAETQEQR